MPTLTRILREFKGLLDLFLPPACPLCDALVPPDSGGEFCDECRQGIRPLPPSCCPRCALPYQDEGGRGHLCEACIRMPPPFTAVFAAGIYENTLRRAVARFKYEGAIHLQIPLAALLDSPLPFRADLIVPVPLHIGRLRVRTYNQSLLLAKALGSRHGIPVAPAILMRSRATPPQRGLAIKARRKNLRGAFALAEPLEGRRVLLVDDVLTTGATAGECCRTLLAGGASEVAVAVIARAFRQRI